MTNQNQSENEQPLSQALGSLMNAMRQRAGSEALISEPRSSDSGITPPPTGKPTSIGTRPSETGSRTNGALAETARLPAQQAGQKLARTSQEKLWPRDDRAKLALALGRTIAMQRTYGKQQGDIETMLDGFCWALRDHEPAAVLQALARHIQISPEIPTPHDLIKILAPETIPFRPNWTLYKQFKDMQKVGGDYALSDSEAGYVRRCEESEINQP